MLQQLFIKNFALIDSCEMTFSSGFNVLSGETGAGKSILIDALGLQIGDRADSDWIRHGETRCEIQTSFLISPSSVAKNWLDDNELDDENLCMLRRTLSKKDKSSKSKAYINTRPTSLSQLKDLGTQLVNIHGQHAHQALMHPESQLNLLDGFAQATLTKKFSQSKEKTRKTFAELNSLRQKKRKLDGDDINLSDRIDLLNFQVSELDALNIQPNEFDELVIQHKQLNAGKSLSEISQRLSELFSGSNQSLAQLSSSALTLAQELQGQDERASELTELIEQASINLNEAESTLGQYIDNINLDPEALQHVENRMSTLHDIARKHRVEPSELDNKLISLNSALKNAEAQFKELLSLDQDLIEAEKAYVTATETLSKLRKQSAKKLSLQIKHQLAKLSMDKAVFSVNFTNSETISSSGSDKITFMIAPNPGQSEKPLHKIASGGELSRVSLAIQVASIRKESGMTLIFDEVDTGIGGSTAEVVGQLLKTLSQYHQIICVTHLAQVASYADNHIKIEKFSDGKSTSTQFRKLSRVERAEELARMSGGINPDAATKAHAEQLLSQAETFMK